MNGPEAAKKLGVEYHKIDYLIRSGVIHPADPGTRGRDREITPRDLELLRLAILLRDLGYRLEVIRFVIDCLDYWRWDLEPTTAQIIALGSRKRSVSRAGNFTWDGQIWAHDLIPIGNFKAGRSLEIPGWTFIVTTNFDPKPT